ncbi:hypothetical protein HZA44_00165, partial [Candidatus Peregrinibacteria bacterium]|nr:hypothetical protein [Candidatus Peregrinibacteria bacterium]
MGKTNNEKKGEIGQKKFIEWLDKKGIPYMFFDQGFSTYSNEFKNLLKRPDFMIFIKNFGFILVDVKNHKIYENNHEYSIALDPIEVKKYKRLHKEFGVQVWFAISNKFESFSNWYWISTNDIEETDKRTVPQPQLDKKEFYKPNIEKFIKI